MKSTSLEKGALEKRLREELFKHDIGTIDQSLKTKERIFNDRLLIGLPPDSGQATQAYLQ